MSSVYLLFCKFFSYSVLSNISSISFMFSEFFPKYLKNNVLLDLNISVFKYNNIPVIIIIITIIDGIAIANAILFFLGIIIFSPFKLF